MTFEIVAIGRGVFGLSMGLLLLLPLLAYPPALISLSHHTYSPHTKAMADNQEEPTADAMRHELERLGGEGTYNSTFTRSHTNML
jgi:hypothetical protein